jgi:hypothetical protein
MEGHDIMQIVRCAQKSKKEGFGGRVMTLPQSGRLDGGEQPQGLPGERAEPYSKPGHFMPTFGVERP